MYIIMCADIILSHFIRSLGDNIMSIVSLFIIYSSSRTSLFLLRTLKCIKFYTFVLKANVFTAIRTIKYIIFRVQYTCTMHIHNNIMWTWFLNGRIRYNITMSYCVRFAKIVRLAPARRRKSSRRFLLFDSFCWADLTMTGL